MSISYNLKVGGDTRVGGRLFQPFTNTAMTDTATISASAVWGGIIVGTPTAAATYTFPTAAALVALEPNLAVGDCIELKIINTATTSGYTITPAAGTGVTVSDATAVAISGGRKKYILRFTNVSSGTEAVTVY